MANALARTSAATPGPAGCPGRLREIPRLAETPPSFDELVAGHRQRVARLCFRLLGWREDVEDVVQEVFLAAFGALPKFRGHSSVSTWLTRITVNACRSHVRRRLRLRRLFLGTRESTKPRIGQPAERELMDHERCERVRRAVRKLPPKYREVVVLRYLEELAVPEIGQVLGLSRNAVEVRLSRARRQLKTDLAGLLEG
ncbi:MAG: RNA polymerase sigma factor [Phycisphaerae bacterium]